MPEFAEVHFQVRWLAQRVTGWTLKSYQCLSRSHLKDLDAGARAGLDAFFQGARLQRVSQRGKLVVFELDRGTITTHLMFKGRWSLDSEVFISNYKAHSEPPTKGLGFEIAADQGKLIFHDIENRAKINIYANQRPDEIGELTDLGPEALVTPETASGFAQLDWHLDEWRAKIARSNKPIKAVLLDQKIVSGIGNVYSCEALYRARIHPARPAKSLSANETKAIYDSTRELLALMIRNGLDYENEKKIYKRDTDPDGRPVTTGDIAGRDSYWVESLQS